MGNPKTSSFPVTFSFSACEKFLYIFFSLSGSSGSYPKDIYSDILIHQCPIIQQVRDCFTAYYHLGMSMEGIVITGIIIFLQPSFATRMLYI